MPREECGPAAAGGAAEMRLRRGVLATIPEFTLGHLGRARFLVRAVPFVIRHLWARREDAWTDYRNRIKGSAQAVVSATANGVTVTG